MLKSRIFIFLLLALAALGLQLLVQYGRQAGMNCCPPSALMLPSTTNPASR